MLPSARRSLASRPPRRLTGYALQARSPTDTLSSPSCRLQAGPCPCPAHAATQPSRPLSQDFMAKRTPEAWTLSYWAILRSLYVSSAGSLP